MVSGRLREHDRNQIAMDLVEWAKHPDSINMNTFCGINLLPPSKLSLWQKEKDGEFFRQCVEIAKTLIAHNRERKLNEGTLNTRTYDALLTLYDQLVKQEKREDLEFSTDLKIKILDHQAKNLTQNMSSSLDQTNDLQAENIMLRAEIEKMRKRLLRFQGGYLEDADKPQTG